MTQFVGRSTLQIAEDMLLEMAAPVYNLNRADCVRLCIQRRELCPELRVEAEQLLAAWEGSVEQMRRVQSMHLGWAYAVSRPGIH